MPRGFRKRACPVCGPAAPAELHAEAHFDPARLGRFSFASRKAPELMHYRLLRCRDCDTVYASPAPPPAFLARAYDAAAFDSGEEAAWAARTYARALRRLGPQCRDGALDIGTGDGAFLGELLKAGFTRVRGVEPSRAPIAAARPELRRLIRHGLFSPREAPVGSLGLVTCFQTLEHLDRPAATLRQALRLLRPGGAFYAVCHNHRALSARLLGRRSPIYDVEHLQLFSPRALRRLLESCGYRDVTVTPILNTYPLRYWLKLLPLPAALKSRLLEFLKTGRLGRLPLALPAGNLLGLGFKPR
jgi:SAM-dependent methyltransferase